jgi:hypothetical protein
MAEVYGLMSTRDYTIRYVGQTKGVADKRAWDHWRSSSNLKVAAWSREELWSGYIINYVVIEECGEGARHDRETYWMQRIPNLLNERKVNLPSVAPSIWEASHLSALQQSDPKGEIANWHGFVGIIYYPPHERARSDFWEDGTELMPECWGFRVYDPFGRYWGASGPAFDLETALRYRQQFRHRAEEYQREHFGVVLQWPLDDTRKMTATTPQALDFNPPTMPDTKD